MAGTAGERPGYAFIKDTLGVPSASRSDNLLDWLFRLRDVQREQRGKGVPLRRDGVKVQHVNTDLRQPVRFVCAELNLLDTLGVDRGAALEQLEDAPD